MLSKKTIFILIILFILFAIPLASFISKKGNPATPAPVAKTNQKNEKNYLLDGYPLDTVPLFKNKLVSSSKFFVKKDPSGYTGYFGHPVNYFNVVYLTEATPDEFLSYYRSLMTEVNPDSNSDESVEGVIGKYKVEASHFGDNPQNYGYLQVYLPSSEYRPDNPYFQNYPSVVDIDASFPEFESSFGYLNQKGGEVEYTRYFPLPEKVEDQDKLIFSYQQQYQSETDYNFNSDSGLMTWKKDMYSVYLTFSRDHGRLYLTLRHPME